MTLAMPSRFEPKTTAELKALREEYIARIKPLTLSELEFLRSVDQLSAEQEEALESIEALDFVIGD